LLTLAEVVAEIAGIDFLDSEVPAIAPSIERRGAIDLLSLSSCTLLVPTNGRSSASSPDSGSGGGGEATSRTVDGRSRRDMPEYRLGTPTVEAGEGGRDSISSTASTSRADSGAEPDAGASILIELRRDLDMRCCEADRLREEASDLIEVILPDDTISSTPPANQYYAQAVQHG
jgi:hypothetical protein